IEKVMSDAEKITSLFAKSDGWDVMPTDDPIKLTIQMKKGYAVKDLEEIFMSHGIYPELTTERQILFILGLFPFTEWKRLEKVLQYANKALKNKQNHATIEAVNLFMNKVQSLDLSYQEMSSLKPELIPLDEAVGKITAEAIIPYPPGIPFLLKGERITASHVKAMEQLTREGIRIQQRIDGIYVFSEN